MRSDRPGFQPPRITALQASRTNGWIAGWRNKGDRALPVDTSIYRNQQPVKGLKLDPLGAQSRSLGLAQQTLQNEKLSNQIKGQVDENYMRKASIFGEELSAVSSLPAGGQREEAYMGIRDKLIGSGVVTQDQMPPQWDDGWAGQTLSKYEQSKEFLNKGLLKAKTRSIEADNATKLAKRRGSAVPGFQVADGAMPTKDDVKKFKTQVVAHDKAQSVIMKLRGYVKEYGTEILPTQGKKDMRQALVETQLQLKELANLGVLNGPDLELMLKELPDPTALADNLNPFAGGQINKVIASMQDILKDKLKIEGEVRGFNPDAGRQRRYPGGYRAAADRGDEDGAAFAGGGGGGGPQGQTVKQGGHTYEWNPQSGAYE